MPVPLMPFMVTIAPQLVRMLARKAELPDAAVDKMLRGISQLRDADLAEEAWAAEDQMAAEAAIMDMLAASDMRQIALNTVEAGSARFWQAGWRPFIGWVCGMAFCWHFLLGPIMGMMASLMGLEVVMPQFEMETLNTTLFGLLGLGAMRSYEKVRGKS